MYKVVFLLINQFFMCRSIVVALLCCMVVFAAAQDTGKKARPVKTYAHKSYSAYRSTQAQTHRLNTDSIIPILNNQSLNAQYQYLISKVYHYQQPLVSALWKNASDTLSANKARLKDAMAKIAGNNKVVDSLKNEINDQSAQISNRNGMEVLGLVIPKATYNIIVWGFVLLFAIIAISVIARSGGYRREARHRTQLYAELEEEYKAFKAKANDKEKKLARELQTERNKLDELLGRG